MLSTRRASPAGSRRPHRSRTCWICTTRTGGAWAARSPRWLPRGPKMYEGQACDGAW